jgi:predicted lipid-binding transport protein (Tim44 family)
MATDAKPPEPAQTRWARRAGAIAQGLALGFLVVLAGMELLSLAADVSPFKYQGF